MSTLMSMGPMIIMDNKNAGGAGSVKLESYDPHHHGPHHMHPGPPPQQQPQPQPQPQPQMRQMPPMQPGQYAINQTTASNPQPAMITSSMNRSQRCGVCRGCQCKPCGHCQYCQDSPQFGGPGVKKQSCIERRCLRVLENRLQRDAPTFKARVGCNQCEDCRLPDCQVCLVCLDKKFFDNRYMTGAMCAKKRCNNATSIELPAAQNADIRQAHKRCYEQGISQDYQMLKRRMQPNPMDHLTQQQQQQQQQQAQRMMAIGGQASVMNPDAVMQPHPGQMYPGGPPIPQAHLRLMQSQVPPQHQLLIPHPGTMMQMQPNQMPDPSQQMPPPPPPPQQQQPQQMPPQQFMPQTSYIMAQTFQQSYFDETTPLADPFLPPSYAPDMKNAVVLQPL